MIWWILSWLIYGVFVGTVAKAVYPGADPKGFWNTVGIGVAGSYVGGFLNYLIFGIGSPFSPSGLLMGPIGAILVLFVYHKLQDKNG